MNLPLDIPEQTDRVFASFDDVPSRRYGLIMADPNWHFDNWSEAGEAKNPKAHYDCVAAAEIAMVDVVRMADRDCLLWLWATNPMLPDALRVMSAWGFTFKTAGVWAKRSSAWTLGCEDPKWAMGTGYVLRGASEPFLIGTRGKPTIASRSVRSVVEAAVREHSRKPDEAYVAAKMLRPDCRALDLYSRQPRTGWDCAGWEARKFAEAT